MSERDGSSQPASGLRIRNQQDFVGGLVLVGLALLALWASADLPGMRGFQFGPGTAPHLFTLILGGLGIAIAITGLLSDGPGLPTFVWRGPLLVTASILLFAVTIRPLGLVLSSFIMFAFSASGSRETKWFEAIVAAAVLTFMCTILFVYLLNLPFQLWPRFTVAGVTIAF